jgi:ParB family chromosome partitioning protein
MAEIVRLIDPGHIEKNPGNPRLIFREDELNALEESIAEQGILVPLTVYEEGPAYIILDGERRWRCALKLGLVNVPVIVQPKPTPLANIMMMFAIHKARSDWDPLPTAIKIKELQDQLEERLGRPATEKEVASAASLGRGEIRRYRNIVALPQRYRDLLMDELYKPKNKQVLTVDQVLESVRGALALNKEGIIDKAEETKLADVLVEKFVAEKLTSTVEPRQLPKIARAVSRGEISKSLARRVTLKLISDPDYTVDDAFRDSVEQVEYAHQTDQVANKLADRLREHHSRRYELTDELKTHLEKLQSLIARMLSDEYS